MTPEGRAVIAFQDSSHDNFYVECFSSEERADAWAMKKAGYDGDGYAGNIGALTKLLESIGAPGWGPKRDECWRVGDEFFMADHQPRSYGRLMSHHLR